MKPMAPGLRLPHLHPTSVLVNQTMSNEGGSMSSKVLTVCLTLLLSGAPLICPPALRAADHRDAPAVSSAGEGDLTDIFAFLDPNDKTQLVLIMGVNPFALPSFTHSYRFSTYYLYQFQI